MDNRHLRGGVNMRRLPNDFTSTGHGRNRIVHHDWANAILIRLQNGIFNDFASNEDDPRKESIELLY